MTEGEHKRGRPKWLDGQEKNRQRVKKSKAHENRIAAKLHGRRLPASGGKKVSKWAPSHTTAGGDIRTYKFLVEHKGVEVQIKSIGVTRKWLKKVTEGATRAMRIPAMVLTYENPDGFEQDWFLLPLDVAKRLLGFDPEGSK